MVAAPVKSVNSSARLLDDDLDRSEVPRLQIQLHHGFGLSTGDEGVAEIVAEPALSSGCPHQPLEPVPAACLAENVEAAEDDRAVPQRVDGRDVQVTVAVDVLGPFCA